jgi:hypothetical protein
MNTGRNTLGGAGTQTAALAFNGGPQANVGGAIKTTESWNGSSWTALSSPSNTNTASEGAGSNGSQTSAIIYGGYIYSGAPNTRTEQWNGSTWTETSNLNSGRENGGSGSGGNNTSAIYFGGASNTNATEEWTGAGNATVTFSDA